ncbi:MAG TPA: DUF4386 domain-containing protein [Thermotogota bacterium]|nr:DUF4386 domain-containing protein [Thermotogota bacterium]HPJ89348.1 DUF4386 domain-containing protein [Thermotogota bacterium]
MTKEISFKKTVKFAGLFYALIMIDALATMIFIDPYFTSDTFRMNLTQHESLFRVGMTADIVMYVMVVFLAVLLYFILKRINKQLATFGMFFRIVEGILGTVGIIIGGIAPLAFLKGGAALNDVQIQSTLDFFLRTESAVMEIVLIFMGIGGILFFYLFLKSKLVPTFWSIWGIITYTTMLILSALKILFPEIPDVVTVAFYTPGSFFELFFGFWLLFKGVKFIPSEEN